MEPNEDTPPENEDKPSAEDLQAPADALSRTPDDLETEQAEQKASSGASAEPVEKKVSGFKKFFKKVNVYFLVFILVVVVTGAIAAVMYLNSQKETPEPNIATQALTEDALKQLANTDATVGDTSQTLTIQGNAIISGQTLARGNLNVAGNFQTGGSVQTPNLTVSGTSNLGTAQINTLQVATNVAIQGSTTMRELNVAGASSFSGVLTASEINVTRLILSGNAILQIPNHISFTGTSPGRTSNNAVLGSGGSSSISGSDTAGSVSINTGSNPTPGCMTRINFQQAYVNQPRVIISPIGSAAGQTQFYVDRNSTGFSICTANAAPANQSFAYDYFVSN